MKDALRMKAITIDYDINILSVTLIEHKNIDFEKMIIRRQISKDKED